MGINIKVGTVYIDVEPDVSKFSEKLRRKLQDTDLGKAVEQTLERATKTVVKFGKESDKTSVSIDRIGDRTSNFNNKMLLLRNTLSLIKIPALFAGAGLIAQALVALAAGGTAVIASLGPLAGLLIAVPAALTAIGLATLSVKLGFEGISEALKGTEGALEKLGPAGQELVKFLKSMGSIKDDLQIIASSSLLPGITRGMREAFSPANISAVANVIAGVGRTLGNLAEDFGKELRSKEWADAMLIFGETSSMALDAVGSSLTAASSGFRDLLIAGQPLIRWLADAISKGIQLAGAWARNASASGSAARFFQQTADVARLLSGIFGGLARALVNIGKAAYPVGKVILVALNDQLAKLSEWTASVGGQASMAEWFESSLPVLKSAVLLLGALLETFFRIGDVAEGSGLTGFFDQIRTEVLPLFEDAINGSKGLGQAVLDLVVALSKFAAIFLSTASPLTAFAHAVSTVAGAIADLVANNPLLADMLVTFVSLLALSKAFKLSGMIAQIWQSVMALRAQNTATKATIASQRGLNAAMRANPIGLIVTALQILATALIVAWQNSETFREVSKQLFGVLRDVGVVVLKAITFQFKVFLKVLEYTIRAASHLPFVGDKFKGAAEKIELVSDTLDRMIKMLANAGKASKETSGEVGKLAAKLGSSTKGVELPIVQQVQAVEASLQKAGGRFSELQTKASDAFANFLGRASAAFDGETKRVLASLDKAGNGILKAFDEVTAGIVESVQDGFNEVVRAFDLETTRISKTMDGSEILKKFDDATESVLDGMADGASRRLDAFDEHTQKLLDNIFVVVRALNEEWAMQPGQLTPAERELKALDELASRTDRSGQRQKLLDELAEESKPATSEVEVEGRLVTVKHVRDLERINEINAELRALDAADARDALAKKAKTQRTAADKAISKAQEDLRENRQVERSSLEDSLELLRTHYSDKREIERSAWEESIAFDLQNFADKRENARLALVDLQQDQMQAYTDARGIVKEEHVAKLAQQALNYTAERELLKEHYLKELEDLGKAISSGKVKAKQAETDMLTIMRNYGVSLAEASVDLGVSFSTGMEEAMANVESQASLTSTALQKVLDLALKVKELGKHKPDPAEAFVFAGNMAHQIFPNRPLVGETWPLWGVGGEPPVGPRGPEVNRRLSSIDPGAATIGQYVHTQIVQDESTARIIGNQAARRVRTR